MQAVKLSSNKLLQFLTQVVLHNGHKIVVVVVVVVVVVPCFFLHRGSSRIVLVIGYRARV